MFNFDDSYAQVSKLKPKIDTTEKFQTKKTNAVIQGDVKLSFLKATFNVSRNKYLADIVVCSSKSYGSFVNS
jgi:hypothetical protein